MKKSLVLFATLPLFLLACSSSTPVNSQTNPLPKAEVKNDISPKYTSDSYVLAEPLPGKKVKISITAKDKSLYIVNCNQVVMTAIFDANTHQPTSNFGSYACRSEDIIIPKGMTLTLIEDSHELASNLSLDKTYYLKISSISYQNQNTKQSLIPDNLATSNEFKLLP